MGTCTLLVGPCTVLLSEGGPPDAEYALFDEGDVELRASTPGSIREVAYRTTVERARARLATFGVNADLAAQAGRAFGARLREVYARGPRARRLVRHLGPAELFDGDTFDPATRRYAGRWLDLASLAQDTKLPRAVAALQALHLAALLSECDGETAVTLTTEGLTKDRRPGERTYKRPQLDQARLLPDALAAMSPSARTIPPFAGTEPSGPELLEHVRGRMALAATAATQHRLVRIERALSMREPPEKGPLAAPDLWEIEVQLTMGDLTDVGARIDAVEAARGRLPGIAYLRARAALLGGDEPASVVAERASALAQTLSGFHELNLLASQAWAEAGDLRRAAAYARDLSGDSSAPADLRLQAEDVAVDASAGRRISLTPPPPQRISVSPPPPPVRASTPPPPLAAPVAAPPEAPLRLATPLPPPPGALPFAAAAPPAPRFRSPTQRPEHSVAPPPPDPDVTPSIAMPLVVPRAPRLPQDDAMLDALVERASRPSFASSPGMPVTSVSTLPSPPSTSGAVSLIPREAPPRPVDDHEDSITTPLARDGRIPSVPPPAPRAEPPVAAHMRGASQPPIATIAPPPMIPPAAPVPRFEGLVEAAERLSLPPGLHGQPPPREIIPATFLEARVTFTHLARDLARDYRMRDGITLRTDVASIEAMQRHLAERFPYHAVLTEEDALEVRRHGAFLSEMLARTLGGYWIDIGSAELGYWAMAVPPSARVLPFGRILRFIALGMKERDLVSFYLELQARTTRGSVP